MKAIWNNTIIAESDETIEIEGSFYFPPDSVRREYLQPGNRTSFCPWKGTAHYYSIHIDELINKNAVWCYVEPKDNVKAITGYMAFWNGVEIIE